MEMQVMKICTVHILDLPNYVLEHIVSYLNGSDVGLLEQTCKSFRTICNQEFIWREKCNREYHVTASPYFIETFGVKSCKDLYTRFLCKYHHLLLLGVFKMRVFPYGGLMHTRFEQGCLLVEQLCPPPNYGIDEKIKRVPWFRISILGDQLDVECIAPYNKGIKHKALLTFSKSSSDKTSKNFKLFYKANDIEHNGVIFNCCNSKIHCSQEISTHQIMRDFGSQRLGEGTVWAFWKRKYEAFKKVVEEGLVLTPYECQQSQEDIMEITPLSTYHDFILPSGIFKGTYCPHGIELVKVNVSDQAVVGIKLTGDPHIPVDKITFKVDLATPCEFEDDRSEEYEYHVPNYNVNAGQLFQVPSGYQCLYKNFPHNYKKCFKGEVQVAELGYIKPRWFPVKFVLFDDDIFAVIIRNLCQVRMYKRDIELTRLMESK